jgi:hypothetical protein
MSGLWQETREQGGYKQIKSLIGDPARGRVEYANHSEGAVIKETIR